MIGPFLALTLQSSRLPSRTRGQTPRADRVLFLPLLTSSVGGRNPPGIRGIHRKSVQCDEGDTFMKPWYPWDSLRQLLASSFGAFMLSIVVLLIIGWWAFARALTQNTAKWNQLAGEWLFFTLLALIAISGFLVAMGNFVRGHRSEVKSAREKWEKASSTNSSVLLRALDNAPHGSTTLVRPARNTHEVESPLLLRPPPDNT